MLEVSWGELALLTGLGMVLAGKKDLPQAARLVGTQLGRVVGLLQGARARADRFAAQSELQQLQHELRAGLRELDAVKAEMALSMSPSRGSVGRNVGVPSANRSQPVAGATSIAAATASTRPSASPLLTSTTTPLESSHMPLPPEKQTIAAVAEEEWKRQGIDFAARAERGQHLVNVQQSGSVKLSYLLHESLVFSQYDRVVQQQEEALQSKFTQWEKKPPTDDSNTS